MVDEKDIVGYNAAGEKQILKNQTAYYKAVECNRKETDENYDVLGASADLNGEVGRQWVAMYCTRNRALDPILADSLLVRVNNDELPAGYETGVHMFGQDVAFNLNNELYDWNKDAPSVYVYYKTDSAPAGAGAAGTLATTGTAALTGVAGLAVGALATALAMTAAKKKKKAA